MFPKFFIANIKLSVTIEKIPKHFMVPEKNWSDYWGNVKCFIGFHHNLPEINESLF